MAADVHPQSDDSIPFCQEERGDGLSGLEPWDLKKARQLLGQKEDKAWDSAANVLWSMGHVGLSHEQQARFFTYQKKAARPLPQSADGQVTKEAVLEHLKIQKELEVSTDDEAAFTKAKDTARDSVVVRLGSVGLFSSKTPIRSLALPDWATGGVLVNTKSGVTEVVLTKHNDLMNLAVWASGPAVDDAVFIGNRYRIRSPQRLTMRQLQFVLYGLHNALDRPRGVVH